MSATLNEVLRGVYLDSLLLMRLSRQIAGLSGVEEAGLMLGTPANKEILREAGILVGAAEEAAAGDLILAVRAVDDAAARAALAEAARLLVQPSAAWSATGETSPRTIRAAMRAMPEANLALISVPGHFAIAEARKALEHDLHVMIFSDNVPIADEAAFKREARRRRRLVMGPDCGTAIIGGVPLGFANAVPRGAIGIIGSSGTGIQEVACLIARAGCGISHAIGTGGRDLSAEVGAITTMMALDALDGDADTRHVVLISKPPAPTSARLVLDRVARSYKPFTICFLGATTTELPANARAAATLTLAAELAAGRPFVSRRTAPPRATRGRLMRGLFAGGTLCAEAQVVLRQAGLSVASNVPVPGALPLSAADGAHMMLDLGDDVFTRGRPHPMVDPLVRDAPLAAAMADPDIAVVLLDVVLGHGVHSDPAGHLADMLRGRDGGTRVVASVTGTEADPQSWSGQVAKLAAAGVVVAQSNAQAAELAIAALPSAIERPREAAARHDD
jgi:FdrA protein